MNSFLRQHTMKQPSNTKSPVLTDPRPSANDRACPRCQGLLVREYLLDMKQDQSIWDSGWRCVNCGAIADPIVQANRLRHQRGHLAVKPKRRQRARAPLVA